VISKKRNKLAAYDKSLMKFNYQQALDDVLRTRSPVAVVAVLEELKHRSGLQAALQNRDDVSLEPFLTFLVKYVTNPRFARVLTQVCGVVLDLYGNQLGQSATLDELFVKLRNQLDEEVRTQKNLLQLSGTVDMLLHAGSTARPL
jgi:U3 small nucleolar RNA-associated protein 15